MIPGAPFGADGHIRLSYATGMEDLGIAMDRMETALSELETMKGR